MDMADLRVFEAVARLGGMNRAATELNTVQSNVTTRIRQLEAEKSAGPDLVIERAQLQLLVRSINEYLQQIIALGAMPKGLDPSLVDFPYRMGDEEVYLCWRLGEKKITHYHGIEGGFSGRKKLPTRAAS